MVACLWNTWHCDELLERQNMSPSAQLTSEQLKEIVEDKMNTHTGARKVHKQVEDAEEVLNPDTSSSVTNSVLNVTNDKLVHECLDEAVRLLNAHPIRQSTEDQVSYHNYLIPGLAGTKFLVYQVWATLLIVSRWIWDSDMPGVLVADEMGLGKTFTTVAAEMICKPLTEKVVIGLPVSILWGNSLDDWVNKAQNDFPWIISNELESPFSAPPPHRDPDDTTAGTSSAFIHAWTNRGGENTWSSRDVQEDHRLYDIRTRFQAH